MLEKFLFLFHKGFLFFLFFSIFISFIPYRVLAEFTYECSCVFQCQEGVGNWGRTYTEKFGTQTIEECANLSQGDRLDKTKPEKCDNRGVRSTTPCSATRNTSVNNWSCVLQYSEATTKSGKGIAQIDDKTLCLNLKIIDPPALDESYASAYCNNTCNPAGRSGAVPYACHFVTTLDCNELRYRQSGGIQSNPFELPKNFSALNRLGGLTVSQLIGRVIRVAMGVIGSITLVIFITGGLIWMTSRGNTQLADKAKKMITWGALGVIVVLTSYAVVNFIFEAFRT